MMMYNILLAILFAATLVGLDGANFGKTPKKAFEKARLLPHMQPLLWLNMRKNLRNPSQTMPRPSLLPTLPRMDKLMARAKARMMARAKKATMKSTTIAPTLASTLAATFAPTTSIPATPLPTTPVPTTPVPTTQAPTTLVLATPVPTTSRPITKAPHYFPDGRPNCRMIVFHPYCRGISA